MFCFCSVLCIIVTLVVGKEFSYFDLLTGTYTREKMYFDLAKLIKNKQKFIVMYIDLNNFKEINDSYGHLAGDKVLESFGYRTSKLGDDIKCYRMGGDEFILIAGLQISTKDKLKKENQNKRRKLLKKIKTKDKTLQKIIVETKAIRYSKDVLTKETFKY